MVIVVGGGRRVGAVPEGRRHADARWAHALHGALLRSVLLPLVSPAASVGVNVALTSPPARLVRRAERDVLGGGHPPEAPRGGRGGCGRAGQDVTGASTVSGRRSSGGTCLKPVVFFFFFDVTSLQFASTLSTELHHFQLQRDSIVAEFGENVRPGQAPPHDPTRPP
jgi:hypothetical protein